MKNTDEHSLIRGRESRMLDKNIERLDVEMSNEAYTSTLNAIINIESNGYSKAYAIKQSAKKYGVTQKTIKDAMAATEYKTPMQLKTEYNKISTNSNLSALIAGLGK